MSRWMLLALSIGCGAPEAEVAAFLDVEPLEAKRFVHRCDATIGTWEGRTCMWDQLDVAESHVGSCARAVGVKAAFVTATEAGEMTEASTEAEAVYLDLMDALYDVTVDLSSALPCRDTSSDTRDLVHPRLRDAHALTSCVEFLDVE